MKKRLYTGGLFLVWLLSGLMWASLVRGEEVTLAWDNYAGDANGFFLYWGNESLGNCTFVGSPVCVYSKNQIIPDINVNTYTLPVSAFDGMSGEVFFRLTAYKDTLVNGSLNRQESDYSLEVVYTLIRIARPPPVTGFHGTDNNIVIFE